MFSLHLFFAFQHFNSFRSSRRSYGRTQGLHCCREKNWWIFRSILSPHLCTGFILCLFSHIVSHWVQGMSDKHIILIASWCYYLMVPGAQVTAGGQWGDLGEKVTLNFVHLCQQSAAQCGHKMAPVEWVQLKVLGFRQLGQPWECI